MLELYANIALLLDDIFALYSVLGSVFLLFSDSDNQAWRWSRVGLALGIAGQAILYFTGMMSERIGFTQLPDNVVNALLGLSLLLIFLRSRRERY